MLKKILTNLPKTDNWIDVDGAFKLWIKSVAGYQIHTVTKIRDSLYAVKVGYGEPNPNELITIEIKENK